MRDIGIALSVKFVLLSALYYAFFKEGAKHHVRNDSAALAQVIVIVPATNMGVVMIVSSVVDLSRLQFSIRTLYRFLFVRLTLGLAWVLFIMEPVYVMTGKMVYRDMTRFWGKLFGINFAMGVTTGITLESQFGSYQG